MFYDCIERAWRAGKVRIGLPPFGYGGKISIEADGLLGMKAKFLNETERRKLFDLMECEAGRKDRVLPQATIRQWVEGGKAVLLTGQCRCGKTRLLSATFPEAVFIDGRTADLSKPHWFWRQVTNDLSRPLVIDEPAAFPPLVLGELLSILRQQTRGYVLIQQAEEGSRLDFLREKMPRVPEWHPNFNFLWVRLRSFDGEQAVAKWQEPRAVQFKNQPKLELVQ